AFRGVIARMGMDPNSAWHWGFGAAGVGMTLGIVQYLLGQKHLGDVGAKPEKAARTAAEPDNGAGVDYLTMALAVIGGVAGVALGLYYGYADSGWVAGLFPGVVGFFAGYLGGILRWLNGDELKRVLVIFILFLFSILFWMTYEQAGSSLSLFADRLTETTILGWTYPSSWFQSVPAIFVI